MKTASFNVNLGVKCGNCHEHHANSEEVRWCYAKKSDRRHPEFQGPKASEKQIKYIKGLIEKKHMPEEAREVLREAAEEGMNPRQASKMIDRLQLLPWAPRKQKERARDGMYRTPEGVIYRVQTAPDSDFRVAKRLIVHGDKGRFEREDKMVFRLKADWRMSEEEAAEYGALYGFCIVCGRTLTDENSIAAGIGPICAEKV